MFRYLFAFVALLGFSACSERPHLDFGDPTVRIRIVSDYAAGIETNRADVVVIDANGRVVARADRNILRDTPLLEGLEVASFDSVPAGRYTLRGSLKRENGTTLGEASLVVNVEGGSVHTLYILSSCEGVACEEGTACLQGTCVDPECSPADPTKCPPNFFCESDNQCTGAAGDCSAERCVNDVCVNAPIAGECAETEYCAREEGCAPIEMPEMPPGPDPLCGTVCRITEEPCRYGYYACSTTSDGNTVLVCTPFTTRPTGAPCGNGTVCNEAAECVEGGDAGVDGGTDAGVVTMDMGIARDLGPSLDLSVPFDLATPLDMRIRPDATPDVCRPNPCGAGTCTPNDRARIGYLCSCPEFYEFSLTTCVDIDECETGDFTCDPLTECVNTEGGHSCSACPDGYSGTGLTGCTPIDECARGTDDCTISQHCVDTTPGYTCHDAVELVGGGLGTCVIFDNGDMKCWGNTGYGVPNPPTSAAIAFETGRTVESVDVGTLHLCAILDDGSLRCQGYNYGGVLGYGDTDNRNAFGPPIALGAGCTAIDADDTCVADRVFAGNTSTCATLNGGDLKCWGGGFFGDLGYGDSATRSIPDPTTLVETYGDVIQVSGGNAHTCAVSDDGDVRCWGLSDTTGAAGSSGGDRLGYGPASSLNAPRADAIDLGTGCGGTCTAMQVTSMTQSSCALLAGGYVKCWGWNDYGQLGTGDLVGLFTPNPTTPVNLGGNCHGANCVAARLESAENRSVCALMTDGSVKCWGQNTNGQLGYDDVIDRSAPDALPIDFGAGERATHIGVGTTSACALLDDLSVRCWGYATAGRSTRVNLRGRGL